MPYFLQQSIQEKKEALMERREFRKVTEMWLEEIGNGVSKEKTP